MIKHILVPLDGSHLAEAALPAAKSLAETLNASVTLLHVIEKDATDTVHRDRHLSDPDTAEKYLKDIAAQFSTRVTTHVHTSPVSDVARSIVDHSEENLRPDLVILTSHGNGGMRDLLFGSIAQIVAAKGKTPVLLVKPIGAVSSFSLRRILVPLDNESNHDAVLPLAQELSRGYKAQLDLLCVIPTRVTDTGEHAAAGSMLPMTAEEYLNMAEEIAQDHFNTHLEEISKVKIPASAEIARGEVVNVIVHTAEKDNADMIIFGTHGKAGFKAFLDRSVAANVARQSNTPILLVPIKNIGKN